ncbi:MAG: HAD family acid phosphatase [Candidatus Xenobiia bacterium LiM19]
MITLRLPMLFLIMLISVFTCLSAASGEEISVQCTLKGEVVPNISVVKEKICQYYDSGQWARDTETVCKKAEEILSGYDKSGKKTAMIFDIDDTLLCNYEMMKMRDFSSNMTLSEWGAWFQKRSAPAIKPVQKLMKKAQEKGVAIFLITGRPEMFRAITEETLRMEGYSGINGIIFFNKSDNDYSAISFKPLERKKLKEKGYTIIMSVGDQDSDLKGGDTEHTVKIPNPMYVIP